MVLDIHNKSSLFYELSRSHYDAIVVEGYDGVGKGNLLSSLSRVYNIKPYRPDYNLWQKYDHRPQDRWKVSGFFWEIFNHFVAQGDINFPVMLFDRGVLSGAVYNNDMSIAEDYKKLIANAKVLHILVTCKEEDYVKFLKNRNSNISVEDIESELYKYNLYSARYELAFRIAELDYINYHNEYDSYLDKSLCASCGHYSYGLCTHPMNQTLVDGANPRCDRSEDVEIQDRLVRV